MALPQVTAASAATKTSRKGTQAGAAAVGDLPSLIDRPLSRTPTRSQTLSTQKGQAAAQGSLWDLVADLPTKQDLQVMAASIVNALTRELHDLRQQVDTVERVMVLESSTTATDAHITTLETEHQAFRRHLVEVQLRLEDGETRIETVCASAASLRPL